MASTAARDTSELYTLIITGMLYSGNGAAKLLRMADKRRLWAAASGIFFIKDSKLDKLSLQTMVREDSIDSVIDLCYRDFF
jgi:hypothetical protein